MKAYTNLEQSKKLAEILPLESADNVIVSFGDREGVKTVVMPSETLNTIRTPFSDIRETIPCWSLAALLSVIPKRIKHYNVLTIDISENQFAIRYDEIAYRVNNDLPDITKDNPVDACVAMILKLHKLKML